MTLGDDEYDRLAYDLARTEFDAVERDGYRAGWSDDGAGVEVRDLESGSAVVYDAGDVVRAASDRELRNARTATPE